METEKQMWSESPNSGQGTLEQRLDSEERSNTEEYGCDSNSHISE